MTIPQLIAQLDREEVALRLAEIEAQRIKLARRLRDDR